MATTNEQALYDDLVNVLHLSPAEAAGFLGNFQVESSFNASASNPAEGAIGFAQWEGGRRTLLSALASTMSTTDSDPKAQIAFLNQELTGPFAGVLSAVKQMTDPAQVAAYVDANYERSSGSARSQRMADASSIYGQIQNHQPLTAGGVLGGNWTDPLVPNGGVGGFLTGLGTGVDSALNDAGKVPGAIVNAALQGVEALGKQLGKWALNAFLVIIGVVLIILALRMLADSDVDGSASSSSGLKMGAPAEPEEREREAAEVDA